MKRLLPLWMRVAVCAALGFTAPLSPVGAQSPCVVPDNGSGTATLPPADCGYLSPTDVHEIVDGLPAGTTIALTGTHHQFACGSPGMPPAGCSFVPSPACQQPGGTLGGERECATSTLSLNLHGTGTLAGWNRTFQLPVSFETHVGPRTPGQPVQQLATDMFHLEGELPPGDPDFDLLRITGGTNNGMPSPGLTTLTQQGAGWAVDSFFDITYRIDFIGHPGGHLDGMSGSTTATIRMATGSGTACVPADCNDGNLCTTDACDSSTGTCSNIQVSCDDGQVCTDDFCAPATGLCSHAPTSCNDGNACTVDGCSQALLAPECDVPDNGGGTATLPPAGCDYLSPTDFHEIVAGLPAGTTVQLGAIHRGFSCGSGGGSVCSFPPPVPGVDCDQPGGTLGGGQECSRSELAMTLHGTGTLAGWNRTVLVPIEFETHTGPRTPGQPVQSFATDIFRMFGQITSPSSDPDFDLLRITAGSDFGMPSPGHTTLRQQPGDTWAVDSFFDITYRIDFVGRPGGHVGMLSGSTTGTIRMQVGQGVGCSHTPIVCDDGDPCTDDSCHPGMGCVFTNDDTNACSDGNACTNDVCSGGQCVCPTQMGSCPSATGHFDAVAPQVPKPIPTTGPPNVVTSTLTVSGVGPYLYDLNARTFITHSSSGQLQVTLRSPGGTIVSLTTHNGGANDNVFNGTLWDDDADPGNQVPCASPLATSRIATDTAYANLAVEATLTPEEPLAAFIGENPNGVWTLTIADVVTGEGGNLANWSLDVSTLSAPPALTAVSYPSADVPKAISATGTPTVESTLSVSGAGPQIGRVRLFTSIAHSFNSDLDFTLTSPGGTIVTIGTDNGATADNVYNATLWDDKADLGHQIPYTVPSAASFMVTDTAYINNVVETSLAPEEALGAFNGENPNGTWTLTISDDFNGDGGALSAWSLELTTISCPAPACEVDCNDGNPCTDDSCNPASGCQHTNNISTCSDGNACTTGDGCSGGSCVGATTQCDDGNFCTHESCNPATGQCVYAINDNACSDSNPCTTGDTCGPISTTLFTETFDSVASPALRADWVSAETPSAVPWTTTTVFSVSAPNSATTDTPFSVSDKTLDSPAFVGGFNMVLEFDNRYNLEYSTTGPTYYDGAVLEIKIGAEPFIDIVTAGGNFTLGGYTGPISNGYSSPIANRQAWSAASTGSVPTQVNLPASTAGQTVVLRWRVASDSSDAAEPPNGQWIDNVRVTGTVAGCQPGGPAPCDDGNPCTDNSCSAAMGCFFVNNAALCDDGNPCTDDSCSPATGCAHVNNTTPCDDANACTTADTCAGGVCVGGPAPNCDDGNGCTDDSCSPATGCVHVNNSASCDDANACTTADTCAGGVCVGRPCAQLRRRQWLHRRLVQPGDGLRARQQRGAVRRRERVHDGGHMRRWSLRGRPCAQLRRRQWLHRRLVQPGDGLRPHQQRGVMRRRERVHDGGHMRRWSLRRRPCAQLRRRQWLHRRLVQPGDGLRARQQHGACDDANACTTTDACAGGAASAALRPTATTAMAAPTTRAARRRAASTSTTRRRATTRTRARRRTHAPVESASAAPHPTATTAMAAPTTRAARRRAASHVNNTAPCDDANACTTADTCAGGVCVGGPAPNCDDGNPCTDDSCSPATGCVHVNNAASCDDANACTTADTCAGGVCVGGPAPNCDDGNGCTDDSCSPATGCVHVNNTAFVRRRERVHDGGHMRRWSVRRRPCAQLRRRQWLHRRLVQPGDGLRARQQRDFMRRRECVHDGGHMRRRSLRRRPCAQLRRRQWLHRRFLQPGDGLRARQQRGAVRRRECVHDGGHMRRWSLRGRPRSPTATTAIRCTD